MQIWETYLRGGQCTPSPGRMDTCLCPPQSLRRSWTALHPYREKKRQRSINHLISSHNCAEMKLHGLLLYKHKEAWRRLFRRRTGESHCIAAGIGCDCNTLSAENRRKTGYFWLHNGQGWRGTEASQCTSSTGGYFMQIFHEWVCFF